MERIPRVVFGWPGLPQLWLHGSWAGLALALGFTVLVNVVLVASFVWTEWLNSETVVVGWLAMAVLWGGSWAFSQKRLQAGGLDTTRSQDDRFREAQQYYLQGDWYKTEESLNRLLGSDVGDVDARLMLATLKRHTGRLDEAKVELDGLQRFEASRKWSEEIRSERDAISRVEGQRKREPTVEAA